MKNFTFQSRLHIYQNVLGKYDLIDKYKFSPVKFNYLKKIEFCYTTHKLVSNQLDFLLFNSFLIQQYFKNYCNAKNKYQIFKITLRNYFICLDFLLNSSFLNEKLSIKDHNSLNNIYLTLPVSFNTDFFLMGLNKNLQKIVLNLKFSNKSLHLSKFLSYYFIPK